MFKGTDLLAIEGMSYNTVLCYNSYSKKTCCYHLEHGGKGHPVP